MISINMSSTERKGNKFTQYRDACNEELSHYPILVRLEVATGVNKVYLVGSVVFVFALMVFLNYAGSLLTNLLGWIYPAYASFKAIETADKKDDTQWLTYWCVFGFLHLLEHASDYLLHWMPFYFLAKSIFLVWLFHGYFRGAETIYDKFLKNILAQATPFIDSYVGRAKEAVVIVSEELKKD